MILQILINSFLKTLLTSLMYLDTKHREHNIDPLLQILVNAYIPQTLYFALDSANKITNIFIQKTSEDTFLLVEPEKLSSIIENITTVTEYISHM